MTNQVSIGSISHGTMRPQALIPCFIYELESIDETRYSEFIDEWDCAADYDLEFDLQRDDWPDDEANGFWYSDYASELLNALFDELQEYAPPYCYFGANEGDGSDYGFWPCWDSIEDSARDGTLVKVNAGDEFPNDATEVLEVNDHGNCTLYVRDAWREVWSVV